MALDITKIYLEETSWLDAGNETPRGDSKHSSVIDKYNSDSFNWGLWPLLGTVVSALPKPTPLSIPNVPLNPVPVLTSNAPLAAEIAAAFGITEERRQQRHGGVLQLGGNA